MITQRQYPNHFPELLILFIWTFPLLSCLLPAQSDHHFDLITLEEGISNGFVTAIHQDKKGFIWLGTANGLNRYDGYSFSSYLSRPGESDGLSNSVIWTIAGGTHGDLWVGTDKGLNHLDPATECFTQFLHDPDNEQSLSHNLVLTIATDTAGRVWVGTANGLNLRQVGRSGFKRYFFQDQEGISQTVKALLCDSAGNLWVGSLDTLYQYKDDGRFLPVAFPATPDGRRDPNYIRMLYEDRKHRLWIGTEGNGVFVFDKKIRKFTRHYHRRESGKNSLSHNRVTAMLEDDYGNYWVGTYGGGLNIIVESADSISIYNGSTGRELPVDVIRSMIRDQAGNLWLGTSYEGLYMVKKHKKRFRNFTPRNSGLSYNKGCSFSVADSQKVWIGTNGGGLNLFDPRTESFIYFRHHPGDPASLPDDHINSIALDGSGQLWLALDGGILARLGNDQKRFSRFNLNELGFGELWLKIVFADRENNIWIGSQTGLFRYSPQDGQFVHCRLENSDHQYGDNQNISELSEDLNGNLWIATHGGLNLYDPVLDSFYFFPSRFDLYRVHQSVEGAFWVTGRNGLARFNPKTKTFAFPDLLKDMPKPALSLLEDGRQRLWVSTPAGLYLFDPARKEAIHFNRKDGLINNQLLHGKLLTGSGEMYFSGISGFTRFHPDEIGLNPIEPPVVLTRFQLFNRDVPIRNSQADTLAWSSPLPVNIGYAEEIELKHWQNDISFEFAAMDFTAPENNWYQHRLFGYDEEWIPTSAAKRSAHYTKLPPGTFTFVVKAANNDGKLNHIGTSVTLTITPAWYWAGWSKTLYLLILLALLYVLYRFRLRQELELAENLRLQELDHLKTKLYTNITHEFRTPLTVILGMAEQLMSSVSVHTKEGLLLIRRNGRQLLRLVNQMLDLSKLESGNLKLEYEQGDIINYLQYLLESFHSMAESKNIRLHFSSDLQECYMDYDPVRLMHIVSNLLSNAIKFTPDGKEVYLIVDGTQLRANGSSLRLVVKDNGVGIPQEQLPFIFDRFYQVDPDSYRGDTRKGEGTGIGLTLTRELVGLMGGEIQVKSELWKGSEFTIILPVTRKHPVKSIDRQHQVSPLVPSLAMRPAAMANKKGGKPVILIVEDNPDLVKYLTAALNPAYNLEVAYDGLQGIEKAVEQIPDLIITDVMMPEKDGFELCYTLKKNELTSHIPIIILTARVDVDSRLTGLRQEADAYLEKPFLEEELKVRISGLLEQRRKLQAFFCSQIGIKGEPSGITPDQGRINMEQEFLKKVNIVMEAHLSDDQFSVEQLSRALFVDTSNLYRKIKAITGLNPSSYIRSFRLSKAKELLLNSSKPITVIAMECGFTNHNYFSRIFKKTTGQTPTKFRKSAPV